MNKTKEVYTIDRYREYETRSVNPQECAPAPTIRIAYRDVTMNDMFTRPEYVKRLKQVQEIIYNVQDQIQELCMKGLTPTAVLMDGDTLTAIREQAVEVLYVPAFRRQNMQMDSFMGLDIAIVHTDTAYLRVVV